MRVKAAVEPLKKQMDDEDVSVAMGSAGAIAKILPRDDARKFLIERGGEKSETVKAAAYDALVEIVKPEDSPFLIAGLEIDNWRVQQGAIRGLERAVRAGARPEAEVYDKVASILGSSITNAAGAAQHFLSSIRNQECLRATIAAVEVKGNGSADDKSWRTRAYAIRTLRHMNWPTCKTGLPAVVRQLGDTTSNVVNEARGLLNYLREERHLHRHNLVPILVAEMEKVESLMTRAAIMREMGEHVEQQYASRVAKVAAATLDAAMEERNLWPAREQSIILLGASGYTGAVEAIAKCVGDDVPNVRNATGSSLARLAELCKAEEKAKVAPVLNKYIDRTIDWRKSAIAARAAGDYPSAEAIGPLVDLLDHPVVNVKAGAAHSLAQIARGRDAELAKSIHDPVHKKIADNRRAWQHGAIVLGALAQKDAVPLLKAILKGGDWRCQTTAANAVTEITDTVKVEDKELSDLLIRAAQSEVLQVQDAANKALRSLTRKE